MSGSAVIMLFGAAALFALFASALAWAEMHARRFTEVPIDALATNRPKRRRF